MRELVAILDSALGAGLSKRQWAAFVAVLRQTLGYRKEFDDLSSGRLAQLTGIQRNHIWQAKSELVGMGLLVSSPGHFGEVLGFPVFQGGESDASANATNTVFPRSSSDNDRLSATDSGSGEVVAVAAADSLGDTPDLGSGDSRFGRESVPKQDTTLSNHTSSNHDNRSSGSGLDVTATNSVLVEGGVLPVKPGSAGVTATDSVLPAEKVLHVKPVGVASGSADLSGFTSGLRWPALLDSGLRGAAAELLCGLPVDAAQAALDVLAMGLEARTVRKPLGYLRALARAAQTGELDTSELAAWRARKLGDVSGGVSVAESAVQALQREQAAEWRWVEQMAALQGLSVEVVATQLGVKKRSPYGSVDECMATAGDAPDPQWRQATRDGPPVGRRVSGSVAA